MLKWYQVIDKKIAISEGHQGNCARDEGRPMVTINGNGGLTGGGRNFLVGLLEQPNLCALHAK